MTGVQTCALPISTTQPATATPANGLTTNATMDEDRERGQSRHVRFGGSGHVSESGEAEEWRRSLEERRSDAHASTAPPGQGEVDSEKGAFRLISSRCGLIEGIASSTRRNDDDDYYSSPHYGIPPNIDYKHRCAYFSHSRRHWQTHPSALSQRTGKRRGRGGRGRREGVECSCCKRNKSGDGSIGV